MTTRRRVLALAAGAVPLAGCGGPSDDPGTVIETGTDGDVTVTDGGTATDGGGVATDGGSGGGLTIEAFDVTAAPGSDARVEVQATEVGGLTWSAGDIPQTWQVSYEGFDPQPTAVQESYPPTLLWEPAVSEVSGTLVVPVPSDAEPGAYTLPVEAQAASGDERAVSEATVTVEG